VLPSTVSEKEVTELLKKFPPHRVSGLKYLKGAEQVLLGKTRKQIAQELGRSAGQITKRISEVLREISLWYVTWYSPLLYAAWLDKPMSDKGREFWEESEKFERSKETEYVQYKLLLIRALIKRIERRDKEQAELLAFHSATSAKPSAEELSTIDIVLLKDATLNQIRESLMRRGVVVLYEHEEVARKRHVRAAKTAARAKAREHVR
jgi:hypothetical protein